MEIFKNKINIFAIVFFIASFIFVVVTLIFNGNNDENKEPIKQFTREEIDIYCTDDYIVKDYNTFYDLESVAQQIISALSEEKYKEIYSLLSSDIAGGISKEQYKDLLKEYYISNFSSVKDADGNVTTEYTNKQNLVNAYLTSNSTYIIEIKNNHDSTTKLGVKLFSNNTYKIIYIGF